MKNPYEALAAAGWPDLAGLGWHNLQTVRHGDLPAWLKCIAALPAGQCQPLLDKVAPELGQWEEDSRQLAGLLMQLHPWRKGPLVLGGVAIDTEWRSDRKWERIAARPRLALEGAYAVAFVVFLVFGLPSQSVADLPARAFDGIRQEGIKVERAVSSGLGELAELGRTAWTDSTERAAEYLASRPSRDASRLERGLQFWTRTARGLATGLWDRMLAPLVEQVRALLHTTPPDGAEMNQNR